MLKQFTHRRTRRVLQQSIASIALAAATVLTTSTALHGQESSVLVDALVRKGVLTDREAEEIRNDLAKEASQSSAEKIKLSSSVSELKLYGDLRLRYQYDTKDFQADPFGVGVDNDREDGNPSGNQRSRWRFRLRLNADFKLTENFFGGVELQTAIASDSANQTFENGFSDYPIFISKAYVGWSPNEWLTVTGGKVPNPFYITDLVWDADINPTGLTEQVAFHKLLPLAGGSGYPKDGKTVSAPADRPWELTLVAGQFIFDDNQEGGGSDITGAETDNDETTDSYLFQTQLIGSYRFSKNLKATIAPGWLIYTGGSATGMENNNEFEDTDLVSGATRNLNLLMLPGDVAFKLGSIKTKFIWDFAYNIEGRKRTENIYRLSYYREPGPDGERGELVKNHSSKDDFAYLVGLQFGENKKVGDWSVVANYRQTGIASVDPNLNDSDFAEGELNTRGVKLGLAYNLSDFAVVGLTYQYAWQLRDLVGGEATGGNAIADANEVQTFQVDLSVKF